MEAFWLILSFIVGFSACHIVNWSIERRALSIVRAKANEKGREVQVGLKDERGALIAGIAGILKDNAIPKEEKLKSALAIVAEHPEAAEQLLNKLRRFL